MDVTQILITILKLAILLVVLFILFNAFYNRFRRWEYDLGLGFEFPLIFSLSLAYLVALVAMEILYYLPYGTYYGGVIGIPKEISDPLPGSVIGLVIYYGSIIICVLPIYLLATYFIRMKRGNLLGRAALLILILWISMAFVNAGFAANQINPPGKVSNTSNYDFYVQCFLKEPSPTPAPPPTLSKEVKIALLPFENIEQPKGDILKTMITNGIIDKLESTKNITLIESYKVEDTLRDIEFEGIVTKEETLMELGKRVYADVVVSGTYKQKGDRIKITATLTLIEEKGKKEGVAVEGDDAELEKICEGVTKQLVERLYVHDVL